MRKDIFCALVFLRHRGKLAGALKYAAFTRDEQKMKALAELCQSFSDFVEAPEYSSANPASEEYRWYSLLRAHRTLPVDFKEIVCVAPRPIASFSDMKSQSDALAAIQARLAEFEVSVPARDGESTGEFFSGLSEYASGELRAFLEKEELAEVFERAPSAKSKPSRI